ncbi:MAG: hypothetical protein ACOC1X_01600 [Promethearchaeota archaeon]
MIKDNNYNNQKGNELPSPPPQPENEIEEVPPPPECPVCGEEMYNKKKLLKDNEWRCKRCKNHNVYNGYTLRIKDEIEDEKKYKTLYLLIEDKHTYRYEDSEGLRVRLLIRNLSVSEYVIDNRYKFAKLTTEDGYEYYGKIVDRELYKNIRWDTISAKRIRIKPNNYQVLWVEFEMPIIKAKDNKWSAEVRGKFMDDE